MSLENTTYATAGLYFLGFGHWFIRFPRVIQARPRPQRATHDAPPPHPYVSRCPTYPPARLTLIFPPQTIEFNANRGSLLHTRTADGLPLTLGLSFQYRYMAEKLHTLYLTYKGDVRGTPSPFMRLYRTAICPLLPPLPFAPMEAANT